MQRQRQRQRQKQEIGIEELETDFPASLHHQIDEITEGIPKVINKNLRMLSEDNIKTVIRYVNATNTEINLSANYRKDIIELQLDSLDSMLIK